MRFHGLDLNLLTALDVLLAEVNITRASRKLCLSQSATSSALARLREHFDDELLIQVGRRMVKTTRAEQLQRDVRDLLQQIENRVLRKPAFDPATLDRRISIMAADSVSIVLLSKFTATVGKLAPRLEIDIRVADDRPDIQIARGIVNLLIIPKVYSAPDHPHDALFQETFCAIVWSESRAYGERLTVKRLAAADHVTVDIGTQRKPSFDRQFLVKQGQRPLSTVIVSSQALAPWHVVGTDRIGVIPLSLARRYVEILPIRILPLPAAVPPMEMVVQWRQGAEADEGVVWVRDRLKAIAALI
jgi:DNA-binding transcriptional LysR family regulator